MVTAQDKALAALCVERGLLDDDAIERARMAHAEALESGGAPPLGQLLVQGGFLNPRLASDLLRELALSSYRCNKCPRIWSYEGLAKLGRYRCDKCGERLERVLKTPTGRWAVPPPSPDATEVLPGRPVRGSSVSRLLVHPPPDRVVAAQASAPPQEPAPNDVLAPGMKIGPYEVVNELGRGAMGVVYLAKRPGLDRRFAIKLLLGGLIADQEAVERFRREAKLASKIQHEAVVSVCDVGTQGGLHYYVMDYCAGQTLKAVLKERGTLPVEEAVSIVAKVARGLAAAHALGIVHRDVKPANVILDEKTGAPRIMDFGLARDDASSAMNMTKTGDIVGTPSYSAPEQLTGKKNVDARIDVYALGIVLYELITGARPFQADTVAHLAALVLTEDPRPLRSVVPEVSPSLEAVVRKALRKKAADRYENAGLLAEDLDRVLAGEPVSVQVPTGLALPGGKKSAALVASVLVLLAALGLGLGLALQRRARVQAEAQLQEALRRAVDQLKTLDRQAALGEPFDKLAEGIAELRSECPAPGLPGLDTAWAKILLRRGRPKAARAAAQPYLEAQGDQGLEAKRVLAEILCREKKTREAAPLLKALRASGNALFVDWATLRAGDSAADTLAAARDRNARSPDEAMLRLLAELEAQDGHDIKACEILDRLLSDIAKDDGEAHLALAMILRRSRSLEQLLATDDPARDHAAAFERFAGEESEQRAEALYGRALNDLGKGFASQSVDAFAAMAPKLDAALALGLDTVDAHALRSWFVDEQGLRSRDRAAKLDRSRAEQLAPPLDVFIALSRVLGASTLRRLDEIARTAREPARGTLSEALRGSAAGHDTARVLEDFDAAAKLAPDCPVVALERARFLLSRSQTGPARKAIEAARSAGAPEADVLLVELFLDYRALSLERAKDVAQKLVGLDGDGVRGRIARAYALRIDGNTEEAATAAAQAAKIAPNDAAAQIALADMLARQKRFGESRDAARTALALAGRLDEEAELLFLRAVSEAILDNADLRELAEYFFRGRAGGRRGGGGGVSGYWTDLEGRISTARVCYYHALVTSKLPMVGRKMAEPYYQQARELDRESPLGEACLGHSASLDRDGEEAKTHWLAARKIDPRWRLPLEWVKGAEEVDTALAEEFSKPK